MDRAAPDLEGKLVVVTGANTGIGRAAAEQLASRGATLVLACRSADRARAALTAVQSLSPQSRVAVLDLADFASVRACAESLRADGRPIDVLLNNAGQAGHRGLTRDGFELAFGVNHLGHFLLTVLLAPLLQAAAGARVVNVSSNAHYEAKGIDFDAVRRPTRTITGLREYEVSKLANVLFTREFARRIGPSGVLGVAVHPGVVASDAWRRIPWPVRTIMKRRMLSNDEGARPLVHCATSTDVGGRNGGYYDRGEPRDPSPFAMDDDLARLLWQKSAEWVGADL